MKNYEKYAEKIREYNGDSICTDFIAPYILKKDSCGSLACGACYMLQTIWLLEEYEEPEEPEEPEVDWSKVEVDTPILVRDFEGSDWFRRHFAKYENGTVYAWDGGDTSWSGGDIMTMWKYAKLAESEEDKE